jgi:ribonuclease PH
MSRPEGRKANAMRAVKIVPHFQRHPEGSALIEIGNTKVICACSVAAGVPRWRRDSGLGWITAEYSMLPRATNERTDREVNRGKVSGRTSEIQRLIGRSLRAVCDMSEIGEFTLTVDCDVIEADGGTRTAAITGGSVALWIALERMRRRLGMSTHPMKHHVAAVSVGILEGEARIDLEYTEDSVAEVDMNVVLTGEGRFVEIQGTAEGMSFDDQELNAMLGLAKGGIKLLNQMQIETCQKAVGALEDQG